MDIDDITARVAEANRVLAFAGHSDMIWGHASLRSPDGDGVWMKASGFGFEEVTPDRVVHIDRHGDVRHGTHRRHVEYHIHTEILAARPELAAVVHTHSGAGAAFASLDEPLRPISHHATPFLSPDVPRFTRSGMLISNVELGQDLAATLGNANGVLIPGHGIVTVGVDLASAVMHAVLLDKACTLQLQAMAAGGPKRWSPDAEVAEKQAMWPPLFASGYAYFVRQLEAATHPAR